MPITHTRPGTRYCPIRTEHVMSRFLLRTNTSNTLFLSWKLDNFALLIVGSGNVGLEKLNVVLANSPKPP